MTVFFTADHHFGHAGAIDQNGRPFANIMQMRETMIECWNEVVGTEDTVYHLGDFAWRIGEVEVEDIFNRLRGRKHLITGNHDHAAPQMRLDWESVSQISEVKVGGVQVVMCHYPLHEWRNQRRGSIHVHGHIHNGSWGPTGSMDVGVDAWEFRPVSLPEILDRIESRKPKPLPDMPAPLTRNQRLQMSKYSARLVELQEIEKLDSFAMIRTAMDTIAHVDAKTRRDLQFICEYGVEWEREFAFKKIGDAVSSVLEDIIEQRILQPGKNPDHHSHCGFRPGRRS